MAFLTETAPQVRPAPTLGVSAPARRGRLSMRNISKRFKGTPLSAIEDITLECRPGEFVVVVGPSGCGKTTILNVAGGMILPEKGLVELDGHPVTEPGPHRPMV